MEQLKQLQAIESLNGVKGRRMLGWNEELNFGLVAHMRCLKEMFYFFFFPRAPAKGSS